MSSGFLSQEEIDSLLSGGSILTATTATTATNVTLSDVEKDALGEIGNISMGSAATTLSILLGHKVQITVPRVDVVTIADVRQQYPMPYVVIEVGYSAGLRGANLLVIRESDACIIADLMMGGDGLNPPENLNELYLSAVGEAMNQMMGATATSMSTMFNKKVDITPPNVNVFNFAEPQNIGCFGDENEPAVKVAFRMEVEGLIDSELMQLLSLEGAQVMVQNLLSPMQGSEADAVKPAPQAAKTVSASSAATASRSSSSAPSPQKAPQNLTVQPVQFTPLVAANLLQSETNIDFIADVPLQVTVELGRTRKLIREILELVPGAVVELDKLAGESVDILVNGRLIAKGEVVVIDENFGVRVTDIVQPAERMKNMQ